MSSSSARPSSSARVDASEISYGVALGKGAFGQVRAALFQGKPVAVKAQEVEVGSEDDEYLQREIRIMLDFQHDNILR